MLVYHSHSLNFITSQPPLISISTLHTLITRLDIQIVPEIPPLQVQH